MNIHSFEQQQKADLRASEYFKDYARQRGVCSVFAEKHLSPEARKCLHASAAAVTSAAADPGRAEGGTRAAQTSMSDATESVESSAGPGSGGAPMSEESDQDGLEEPPTTAEGERRLERPAIADFGVPIHSILSRRKLTGRMTRSAAHYSGGRMIPTHLLK